MASTYELIETTTLTSSASSVTFSSITQDYRDLVLVINATRSSFDQYVHIEFNGDTGANYSYVNMFGNGSSTDSFSQGSISNGGFIAYMDDTVATLSVTHIMDYSATDKHKTFLSRAGSTAEGAWAFASRWANTSAITSLIISNEASFDSGGTFSLYGIAS